MHAFWLFARAPLAWSLAVLALYAPLAFSEPVIEPPPPGCDDWLWCDSRYVGLVFDPAPDPENLYALLIIPSAFIAFLAARVAARGPNRHAHWFMAGPALALIAGPLVLLIMPVHMILLDVAASYPFAVIALTLHAGVTLGMLAALPLAILTLLGALAWRLLPPGGARTTESGAAN